MSRLEEIKHHLGNTMLFLNRKNGKTQLMNDLNWLIEQAERVQKLEKENAELKSDKGVLEMAIANVHLPKIERYKQALDFYADRQAYYYSSEHVSEVMQDYGSKARKALEADTHV